VLSNGSYTKAPEIILTTSIGYRSSPSRLIALNRPPKLEHYIIFRTNAVSVV
jgi:hypothetical protein